MNLKKILNNLNVYKKILTSGINKYFFEKAVNTIFRKFNQIMQTLVLGGNGLLGSEIVKFLHIKGVDVIVGDIKKK